MTIRRSKPRHRTALHDVYRLLNGLALVMAAMVVALLMRYRQYHQVVLGVRYLFVAGLVCAMGFLVLGLVTVWRGQRDTNCRLWWTLVAAVAGVELGAHLFWPLPSHEGDIYMHPAPYVMSTGQPNSMAVVTDRVVARTPQPTTVHMNAWGVRIERPLAQHKPAGEIRVAMLGGSTVVDGDPLSHTLPGQLQQLVHAAGRTDVYVDNFGIVGAVSGQELALLVHRLVDYQPDLVIVYDGANDVNVPYQYDPRPGYPDDFFVVEAVLQRHQHGWDLPAVVAGTLYRHSAAARLLLDRFLWEALAARDTLRVAVGYGTPAWEVAVVDAYQRHVETMCGVARGVGFPLVVALQPMAHEKWPLTAAERRQLGDAHFQAYVHRQYDRLRAVVAAFDARHAGAGCDGLDLSRTFDGHAEEVFFDVMHIDNAGNQVVAHQLYRQLMARQAIPRRTSVGRQTPREE